MMYRRIVTPEHKYSSRTLRRSSGTCCGCDTLMIIECHRNKYLERGVMVVFECLTFIIVNYRVSIMIIKNRI